SGHRESIMKFPRIAFVAALLMATYGLPSAFAQTSVQTTPDRTPAVQQPAPDQTGQGDKDAPVDDKATKSNEPKPVPQKDDSQIKHNGGKDDVDAIGNRKMGNRGLGNWYSIEGEIRM